MVAGPDDNFIDDCWPACYIRPKQHCFAIYLCILLNKMEKKLIVKILLFFILVFCLSIGFSLFFIDKDKEETNEDFFYFYQYIENYPEEDFKNYCNIIENSYLQYVCLRLEHRPHMLEFLDVDVNDVVLKKPEKCKTYEGRDLLLCTYIEAAKIGKENISKGKEICKSINDTRFSRECNFYVFLPETLNIEEKTDEKIEKSMYFCKNISYPPWKSECYFVLADELTLLNDSKYLMNISDSCKESYLAEDYLCFHHVVFLMSLKNAKMFCNITEIRKEDCYKAIGDSFSRKFNNVSKTIKLCKELNDYEENCFEGIGDYVGHSSGMGFKDGLESCKYFPGKYEKNCYNGIISSIAKSSSFDLNESIEKCKKLSSEYRGDCMYQVSKEIFELEMSIKKDTSLLINKCESLSNECKAGCFEGVVNYITRQGKKINYSIKECSHLPVEYKDVCFNGIIYNIKQYHKDDVILIKKSCDLLPKKYRDLCLNELVK
jgi:hypothetical protein